jgi:hypothetical protein
MGAESHGMDSDAQANRTVGEQRLYQLLRLNDGSGGQTFTIQLLDSGVQAFAFTFG